MQGLIDGWSGKAPTQMDWLIAQSKAVPPDSPASSGFFDIFLCNVVNSYRYVWTTTNQGSSGSKYSPYALMKSASFPTLLNDGNARRAILPRSSKIWRLSES
jgi:hypothetical protein